MPKLMHIDPDELLVESFKLGKKVYESGFRPKHAISIWRGGTPIGLGVDAYFRNQGFYMNHTTIATDSYVGIGERESVTVKGLEHVIKVICQEDGLLIVDDVYESGNTIRQIVETLKEGARANMPKKIMVATVHDKPGCHQYDEIPLISMRQVPEDVWIDYPHELADMVDATDPEDQAIRRKDEEIWRIIRASGHPVTEEHIEGGYRYLTMRELLLDSFKLGTNLCRDEDFFPDFLIALWPGGISSGLPVHEVYKYFLKKSGSKRPMPDHISLTTLPTHLSYQINVIGIRYLEQNINRGDNVLVIDTTFRSGKMANDAITKLKRALRRNLNDDRVRVASVYYNPEDQSTWTVKPMFNRPHYYLKQIDGYIIYPYNVHRLKAPRKELAELNPGLHKVLFG